MAGSLDFGALAQGIGSAVQGVLGMGAVALNNNQQWRNWKRQHEYLLQDWYLQNQYNSPRAQMRRFEKAGLNPNLIYGQSNTASGIDTPAPPSTESPLGALDVEGAVNAYLNRKIQLRQLDIQQQNSDALVKLYAAKADQANTSAALNNAMTALKNLQKEGYQQSGYYFNQGSLLSQKLATERQQLQYLINKTTIADLQGQFLKKTMDNRVRMVQAQLFGQYGLNRLNSARYFNTLADTKLKKQEASFYPWKKGLYQQRFMNAQYQNSLDLERLVQLKERGDYLFDSYPLQLDLLRGRNSLFPYQRSWLDMQHQYLFEKNNRDFWDIIMDTENNVNPYKFMLQKHKW